MSSFDLLDIDRGSGGRVIRGARTDSSVLRTAGLWIQVPSLLGHATIPTGGIGDVYVIWHVIRCKYMTMRNEWKYGRKATAVSRRSNEHQQLTNLRYWLRVIKLSTDGVAKRSPPNNQVWDSRGQIGT